MIYKVAIIVKSPYVIEHKILQNGKEEKYYDGILYELWNKIKKKLKLEVTEHFYHHLYIKDILEKVDKGDVDIIIGNLSLTKKRAKHIYFTHPIILNIITIGYYPKKSMIKQFFNIFFTRFIYVIFTLIFFGLFIGYILYKVEPKRGFRRAILSTIASLFGEMGFISENSYLSMKGIILVILIMIISFYSTIFLQAITVDKVLENTNMNNMSISNIKKKKILVHKFDSKVDFLRNTYNLKLTEVPNTKSKKIYDEVYKYYKNNQGKYDGIIVDYEIYSVIMEKDNNFMLMDKALGYEYITFGISKKYTNLKDNINNILMIYKKNNIFVNICKKYLPESDIGYCKLLS